MSNKPPCADWQMWTGLEIEGHSERGAVTLFVRGGNIFKAIAENPLCKQVIRIWLCKEFLFGNSKEKLISVCRTLSESGDYTIAVEVPLSQLAEYMYLRPYVYFYIKWETHLRSGDHICIGEPFHDENFRIGDGMKMSPQPYMNDVRIA